MAIIHKGTYFVQFMGEDDKIERGLTRAQAMALAEKHVGNSSYIKPFPDDECYLFGPGDGTTSVMVREEVEFKHERISDTNCG